MKHRVRINLDRYKYEWQPQLFALNLVQASDEGDGEMVSEDRG